MAVNNGKTAGGDGGGVLTEGFGNPGGVDLGVDTGVNSEGCWRAPTSESLYGAGGTTGG